MRLLGSSHIQKGGNFCFLATLPETFRGRTKTHFYFWTPPYPATIQVVTKSNSNDILDIWEFMQKLVRAGSVNAVRGGGRDVPHHVDESFLVPNRKLWQFFCSQNKKVSFGITKQKGQLAWDLKHFAKINSFPLSLCLSLIVVRTCGRKKDDLIPKSLKWNAREEEGGQWCFISYGQMNKAKVAQKTDDLRT